MSVIPPAVGCGDGADRAPLIISGAKVLPNKELSMQRVCLFGMF